MAIKGFIKSPAEDLKKIGGISQDSKVDGAYEISGEQKLGSGVMGMHIGGESCHQLEWSKVRK